jgi:hypothetical protein
MELSKARLDLSKASYRGGIGRLLVATLATCTRI